MATPPTTTQNQADEQFITEIMARIANAPNCDGQVSALLDGLEQFRSIQKDTKGAQAGRRTRERWIFNVTIVGWFITAFGRSDLAEDWLALLSALYDLNRGTVHKALQKSPRKGGPTPRGTDVRRAQAVLAAAFDALARAELPLKQIKRIIDDRQSSLQLLLDEKKRTNEYALGDAAEGWREQFNNATIDNFQAMEAYRHCQSLAAKCTSHDELKGLANWLLFRAMTMAAVIERDSG